MPTRKEPMTEPATPTRFEQWALLEIMGHQRYAGLVSEQAIAGGSLVRIDIPEVNGRKGFTNLFGVGSVYAITPMEEAAARVLAERLQVAPIQPWELPKEFQRHMTYNESDREADDPKGDF